MTVPYIVWRNFNLGYLDSGSIISEIESIGSDIATAFEGVPSNIATGFAGILPQTSIIDEFITAVPTSEWNQLQPDISYAVNWAESVASDIEASSAPAWVEALPSEIENFITSDVSAASEFLKTAPPSAISVLDEDLKHAHASTTLSSQAFTATSSSHASQTTSDNAAAPTDRPIAASVAGVVGIVGLVIVL